MLNRASSPGPAPSTLRLDERTNRQTDRRTYSRSLTSNTVQTRSYHVVSHVAFGRCRARRPVPRGLGRRLALPRAANCALFRPQAVTSVKTARDETETALMSDAGPFCLQMSFIDVSRVKTKLSHVGRHIANRPVLRGFRKRHITQSLLWFFSDVRQLQKYS